MRNLSVSQSVITIHINSQRYGAVNISSRKYAILNIHNFCLTSPCNSQYRMANQNEGVLKIWLYLKRQVFWYKLLYLDNWKRVYGNACQVVPGLTDWLTDICSISQELNRNPKDVEDFEREFEACLVTKFLDRLGAWRRNPDHEHIENHCYTAWLIVLEFPLSQCFFFKCYGLKGVGPPKTLASSYQFWRSIVLQCSCCFWACIL